MRKKSKAMVFCVAAFVVMALLFSACSSGSGPDGNVCKVRFDLGYGGLFLDPINVPKGESIGAVNFPPAPKREGYVFKGWYVGDQPYNPSTIITGNVTLVVRWNKIHTVIFDPDSSAADAINPSEVENGQPLGSRFPSDPRGEAGFLFNGWWDGETQYLISTPITSDLVLTAKWFQGFRVTIDTYLTAESITTILIETNKSLGEKLPAAIGDLPEPFTFGGWFNQDGEEVTSETSITKNMTIGARWVGEEGTYIVGATNAAHAVWKFTVSEGNLCEDCKKEDDPDCENLSCEKPDKFGNYTKIAWDVMFTYANKSTANPPQNRVFGPYTPSNFADARTNTYKFGTFNGSEMNAERILKDWSNYSTPRMEWRSFDINLDLSGKHNSYKVEVFPEAGANGDFYFAFSPTTQAVGSGNPVGAHVTSFMRNIRMTNDDGSKVIMTTGGVDGKPTYVGWGNEVQEFVLEKAWIE